MIYLPTFTYIYHKIHRNQPHVGKYIPVPWMVSRVSRCFNVHNFSPFFFIKKPYLVHLGPMTPNEFIGRLHVSTTTTIEFIFSGKEETLGECQVPTDFTGEKISAKKLRKQTGIGFWGFWQHDGVMILSCWVVDVAASSDIKVWYAVISIHLEYF